MSFHGENITGKFWQWRKKSFKIINIPAVYFDSIWAIFRTKRGIIEY